MVLCSCLLAIIGVGIEWAGSAGRVPLERKSRKRQDECSGGQTTTESQRVSGRKVLSYRVTLLIT